MARDIGYQKGAIFQTGTVVVLGFSEKLLNQNVDHSFVAWWSGDKWIQLSKEDPLFVSVVRGRGKYDNQTVFVGMYGEVLAGTPTGVRREQLGTGTDAPNRLRTIHEARAIGEHFVAVGMRRQVFRRHMGASTWERMDQGVFIPDTSQEVGGFLSVDGFDEKEIYAVGHRGEIWRYDGRRWSQIESPTNMILNSVRCLSTGQVVASGDGGVILRGRGDSWTQVAHDVTSESLTSVASLEERVYVATEAGTVFALVGETVEPVQIKKQGDVSTGFVDSNGRSLLSVGESDIYLYDGRKWTRLPDPKFKVPR